MWSAGSELGWSLEQTCVYYGIVGDDVVIFHEALAKAYLQLILDVGIQYSASKSIVPTSRGGGIEFLAK
jgi:hypothetical protein